MQRFAKPLLVAACFSLLSVQLSGLHVHADDHGYVGIPETALTHSQFHHNHDEAHHSDHDGAGLPHDHEEARDVSLFQLALNVFKMPLATLALVLLFALLPSINALIGFDFACRVLSGRHTRWRPPLRAPPLSA